MNEESLRERFRALREAEARQAPTFEQTLLRAEPSSSGFRSGWLLTPAVAFGAALWLLVLALPGASPRPEPLGSGWWTTPTDVLLDVPGSDLLHEVPAIGAGIEGSPLAAGTG